MSGNTQLVRDVTECARLVESIRSDLSPQFTDSHSVIQRLDRLRIILADMDARTGRRDPSKRDKRPKRGKE